MTIALTPLMLSTRVDWNTPANIVALLRGDFSGKIALDPCSNSKSIVNAVTELNLNRGEDGLSADWLYLAKGGLVYVNPPYGREITSWINKCVYEANKGSEIIALVPARTDSKWFQRCWGADSICFWRGRLKFLDAPSSAPFPSALIYWGNNIDRFNNVFGPYGKCISPSYFKYRMDLP